ncbi:MAG: cytochrome c oxidase assembly protein [Pseudomonadota bacterium]
MNASSARVLTAKLALMVVSMFAFGYLLVPIYSVFCDITGLGGKTGDRAEQVVEAPDLNRVITLEFVASVNQSAPWRFKPVKAKIQVHPGKLYTADFIAENLTGVERIGQAVPSVSPGHAARYLRKTECFCFEQQEFQAGEELVMPVRFIIDPALPDYVDTLSLSYTFFDVTRVASSH